MFEISELARDKIKDRLQEVNRPELALRAEIVGRSEDDFHYRLSFVPEELRRPDDEVITANGLTVLVDPVSNRCLDGAWLNYVDEADESGFKFENPDPLWHDEHASEVNEVIVSQINPSIAVHGGHVTLMDVQDNGPGVPPELREKIFETGFTTKSRDEGTGLGLGSNRKIVEERHRGEISLTSEPGNTRFEVRLPINFEEI